MWPLVARELGDEELTSLMLLAGVSDESYRAATARVAPPISALQRSSPNLLFNGAKATMTVPATIMQILASPPAGASELGVVAVRALMNMSIEPLVIPGRGVRGSSWRR